MPLFKDREIKLLARFNIQANHREILSDTLNKLFFLDLDSAQNVHLFNLFQYFICSETLLMLQTRFYSWFHVEYMDLFYIHLEWE